MAVRGVHNGIDLEKSDIALPVRDIWSYFDLDASSDGRDGP